MCARRIIAIITAPTITDPAILGPTPGGSSWWLVGDDTEVDYSGPGYTSGQGSDNWPNASNTGDIADGGLTIVNDEQFKVWQNGTVSKLIYSVSQVGDGNPAIHFGLFRFDQPGNNWDSVYSMAAFVAPGTGKHTITLSPAWDVRVGDRLAVWLQGTGTDCQLSGTTTGNDGASAAGDVIGTNNVAFSTAFAINADMVLRGKRPKLALIGDSWCGEGHSGQQYAIYLQCGLNHINTPEWSGDFTSWVNYWMEQYQVGLTTVNFSRLGQALSYDLSTNLPAALLRKPDIVILHNSDNGAGDVANGGWNQMNQMQTLLNAATPVPKLFVVDMPPTLDSELYRNWIYIHVRDWCARNGAALISIWADMRSGGAMKAEYRHANYPTDSAHGNYVAAQRQAQLINAGMAAWYASGDEGFDYTYTDGVIAASTAFTHPADFVIGFEADTPTTAGNAVTVSFRQQDTNNKWTVNIFGNGAMSLVEVVAGVPTDRATAANGTVLDNNRIEIVALDEHIEVFVQGVERMDYASAANFKTATGGFVNTIAAGGALEDLAVFAYEWSGLGA